MLLSNNLKAVLYPDDMLGQGEKSVQKEKCYTVQNFNYRCERSRNDAGFPFGDTNPAVMAFTVRLVHPEEGVVFHKRLIENEPSDYTFLFNATYNDQQRLRGYDNAMTVNGFVVDVEDDFSAGGKDIDNRQMLIRVKLFINSVTYKGKMKDEVLVINSVMSEE